MPPSAPAARSNRQRAPGPFLAAQIALRKRVFLSVCYACPEPVLANTRFLVASQWHHKKRLLHTGRLPAFVSNVEQVELIRGSAGDLTRPICRRGAGAAPFAADQLQRHAARKHISCRVLALCLSRADVGKMMTFLVYNGIAEDAFSLCLSRACLGKMIVLIYIWHRKKCRFLTWS